MTKPKHVLIAEDSLEGILSAVSYAYKSRYGHEFNEIRIAEDEQTELFTENIKVPADPEAARNVYNAVIDKIGMQAAVFVENASISFFPDRGDAVYRFLIDGFRRGPEICRCSGAESVSRIWDISRNVGNETNHWIEFLRFASHDISENRDYLSNADGTGKEIILSGTSELLTAVIEPGNRILPRIMPHFADRFPSEVFLIYDKSHDIAGIHVPKKQWIIVNDAAKGSNALTELLYGKERHEAEMQELWKIFFKATDIPERANEKLQRNLLPKWFRKNMTEFT